MKASKKRGFTMIELVIVIAVVAILAAVLIPVFSNLIEQAKEANDTTLVRNLNTAAKLGNKHYDTMYDVLKTVDEEGGYNVSKINAQSKSEILWDMENQCFVMLKDCEEVKSQNKYNYWKIYSKGETIPAAAEQIYSVYVADDTLKTLPEMNVGIDLGNNSAITTVNYVNAGVAQTVTIRTNVGTLTVNAKSDTIYHYGAAERVNVDAVAEKSYHEFGEAKAIIVKVGRVVAEKDSVVKAVIATPTTDAKVDVEVSTADTIVYAPETVTVVGTKITGEIAEGDIENAAIGFQYFAGGLGTEESPWLLSEKDQLTAKDKVSMRTQSGYYKLVADITVDNEVYLSGKTWNLDLNGHSLKLDYGAGVTPNNGGVLNIAGKKSRLVVTDSSEKQNGAVIGCDKNYSNKVTSAIRVGNYGKLDIYGGHFYGTSEGTSCIFVMTSMSSGSKATVNIYGGKFETASPSGGKYFVLNHQDSATGGCTITVTGGSFKNYNPGVTEVDPVNAKTGKISLGTGCTTTSEKIGNDTWYTVTKPAA